MRQHASPTEESLFDNLVEDGAARDRNNSGDFESHLDDLRSRNFMILVASGLVCHRPFQMAGARTPTFPDASEHAQLVAAVGSRSAQGQRHRQVARVVANLDSIRIGSADDDDMMAGANIVRS